MWTWLGSALQSGLNAIGGFFAAVLQFFSGFIYLLERIVQLAGLVVQVVLLLGQVLASIFQGILTTFANLATVTPTASTYPGMDSGFAFVVNQLDPSGFQTLGDFMAVCIWIAFGLVVLSHFNRN